MTVCVDGTVTLTYPEPAPPEPVVESAVTTVDLTETYADHEPFVDALAALWERLAAAGLSID